MLVEGGRRISEATPQAAREAAYAIAWSVCLCVCERAGKR